MYKIQTLNKISHKGLDLLSRDDYEVAGELPNPEGIVVRSFNMLAMEIPASVKAIARAGAGVNNIPVDKCTEKGIVVFNTPGANANAVKELVLNGLFLSARKITDGISWTKSIAGKGPDIHQLVEKEKSTYGGTEIKGKKLGIIGLGAIGVMVANDAIALGMEVTGYDPYITVDNAWGMDHRVNKSGSLDLLLSESDYITLHVPLTDNTKGMLNRDKFNLAKKGVKILNFARGGLVNNTDIVEALISGKVGSYVCDFPEEELLALPNVICMPHLGASTEEAEENCAVMAIKQIKSYLETGNIKNSVNFPDTDLPFTSNYRVVLANKNIPNMVGQITTILAKEKINISDMINKHKGDIAYNIINLDSPLNAVHLESLKKIEGIVMVGYFEKKLD
jgi:D-3-phosphoglycerate dehydrogenase / 2-oxoglutarate reductase